MFSGLSRMLFSIGDSVEEPCEQKRHQRKLPSVSSQRKPASVDILVFVFLGF